MSDPIKETTPDELMRGFRGRSLKSMLLFTLVVHAVFIIATSLPGIIRGFGSDQEGEMTAEQRTELAVKEATASLREIAQRHGMTAQDLGSRFAGPARATTGPASEPAAEEPAGQEPGSPPSAIEQELETTAEGPTLPAIPETDDEDLFE